MITNFCQAAFIEHNDLIGILHRPQPVGNDNDGFVFHQSVDGLRPQNTTKYAEKMEEEKINLHDERKEKFRNLSGRYAYLLGLITICISIVVFSVLSSLGIMQNAKILILYLSAYAAFQYIAGILIFRHLDKKY